MGAVTLDLVLGHLVAARGPNRPLFGPVEIPDNPNVVPASLTSATWWPNLQLAPSGGQICNLCKWFQLVAKFTITTIGAICWTNFQPMQVVAIAIIIFEVKLCQHTP